VAPHLLRSSVFIILRAQPLINLTLSRPTGCGCSLSALTRSISLRLAPRAPSRTHTHTYTHTHTHTHTHRHRHTHIHRHTLSTAGEHMFFYKRISLSGGITSRVWDPRGLRRRRRRSGGEEGEKEGGGAALGRMGTRPREFQGSEVSGGQPCPG